MGPLKKFHSAPLTFYDVCLCEGECNSKCSKCDQLVKKKIETDANEKTEPNKIKNKIK